MGRERRKNTRVAFQATADVTFAGQSYQGCETENLSVKGVAVLGITGHAVGETCDLALALSGSSSELRLTMRGKVVRVEENGVALNFIETDLESFYHLKNIIYYNSQDPDAIEQELIRS
ncbi:MAG: PilZ domain-containing protein [Desulfobacteraceae bacterium]|nr:PilZ domain-containing protein [Desulfobacteraceae bacterium]